ncbi:MAG: hypothetical protein ACYC2G_10860 [Gemmatimonadaceae bacterium]
MAPPEGGQKSWLPASLTKAVQHSYVNARVRDINRNGRGALVDATLAAIQAAMPSLRKAKRDRLMEVFAHMTGRLQSAPLTINLMAPGWFSQRNDYDGYIQMYERAVKGGQMRLDNSDPKNPAAMRAAADDIATMPSAWADLQFAPSMTGGDWSRREVKVAKGAAPARGLAPRARGAAHLIEKMSPGRLVKSATANEFTASNAQFDPRTKQVFAALNYGRRPHGACTDYGHSYIVLSDRFKRDALYFAGDTFGVFTGQSVAADDQLSYDLIGASFLKANQYLRADLLRSCQQDCSLTDTSEKDLLFEAHLFEEVKFSGGITQLCISGRDPIREADGSKRPITGGEFQNIQTNARTFAAKHGARLVFID